MPPIFEKTNLSLTNLEQLVKRTLKSSRVASESFECILIQLRSWYVAGKNDVHNIPHAQIDDVIQLIIVHYCI